MGGAALAPPAEDVLNIDNLDEDTLKAMVELRQEAWFTLRKATRSGKLFRTLGKWPGSAEGATLSTVETADISSSEGESSETSDSDSDSASSAASPVSSDRGLVALRALAKAALGEASRHGDIGFLVNGVPVPAREEGQYLRVKAGETLRVGLRTGKLEESLRTVKQHAEVLESLAAAVAQGAEIGLPPALPKGVVDGSVCSLGMEVGPSLYLGKAVPPGDSGAACSAAGSVAAAGSATLCLSNLSSAIPSVGNTPRERRRVLLGQGLDSPDTQCTPQGVAALKMLQGKTPGSEWKTPGSECGERSTVVSTMAATDPDPDASCSQNKRPGLFDEQGMKFEEETVEDSSLDDRESFSQAFSSSTPAAGMPKLKLSVMSVQESPALEAEAVMELGGPSPEIGLPKFELRPEESPESVEMKADFGASGCSALPKLELGMEESPEVEPCASLQASPPCLLPELVEDTPLRSDTEFVKEMSLSGAIPKLMLDMAEESEMREQEEAESVQDFSFGGELDVPTPLKLKSQEALLEVAEAEAAAEEGDERDADINTAEPEEARPDAQEDNEGAHDVEGGSDVDEREMPTLVAGLPDLLLEAATMVSALEEDVEIPGLDTARHEAVRAFVEGFRAGDLSKAITEAKEECAERVAASQTTVPAASVQPGTLAQEERAKSNAVATLLLGARDGRFNKAIERIKEDRTKSAVSGAILKGAEDGSLAEALQFAQDERAKEDARQSLITLCGNSGLLSEALWEIQANRLRTVARGTIIGSLNDGTLEDAMAFALEEQDKEEARDALIACMESGRLSEVMRTIQARRAKERVRQALLGGADRGDLARVFQEVQEDEDREVARESLVSSMESGGFQEVMNAIQETRTKAMLCEALHVGAENGTLARALESAEEERDRTMARNALIECMEGGGLREVMVQIQDHRDKTAARSALVRCAENGALERAMERIQEERDKSEAREALIRSAEEGTMRESIEDIKDERMRRALRSSLENQATEGRIAAAIEKVKEQKLRRSVRDVLSSGAADGRLAMVFKRMQEERLRQKMSASLLASLRDGRLEAAVQDVEDESVRLNVQQAFAAGVENGSLESMLTELQEDELRDSSDKASEMRDSLRSALVGGALNGRFTVAMSGLKESRLRQAAVSSIVGGVATGRFADAAQRIQEIRQRQVREACASTLLSGAMDGKFKAALASLKEERLRSAARSTFVDAAMGGKFATALGSLKERRIRLQEAEKTSKEASLRRKTGDSLRQGMRSGQLAEALAAAQAQELRHACASTFVAGLHDGRLGATESQGEAKFQGSASASLSAALKEDCLGKAPVNDKELLRKATATSLRKGISEGSLVNALQHVQKKRLRRVAFLTLAEGLDGRLGDALQAPPAPSAGAVSMDVPSPVHSSISSNADPRQLAAAKDVVSKALRAADGTVFLQEPPQKEDPLERLRAIKLMLRQSLSEAGETGSLSQLLGPSPSSSSSSFAQPIKECPSSYWASLHARFVKKPKCEDKMYLSGVRFMVREAFGSSGGFHGVLDGLYREEHDSWSQDIAAYYRAHVLPTCGESFWANLYEDFARVHEAERMVAPSAIRALSAVLGDKSDLYGQDSAYPRLSALAGLCADNAATPIDTARTHQSAASRLSTPAGHLGLETVQEKEAALAVPGKKRVAFNVLPPEVQTYEEEPYEEEPEQAEAEEEEDDDGCLSHVLSDACGSVSASTVSSIGGFPLSPTLPPTKARLLAVTEEDEEQEQVFSVTKQAFVLPASMPSAAWSSLHAKFKNRPPLAEEAAGTAEQTPTVEPRAVFARPYTPDSLSKASAAPEGDQVPVPKMKNAWLSPTPTPVSVQAAAPAATPTGALKLGEAHRLDLSSLRRRAPPCVRTRQEIAYKRREEPIEEESEEEVEVTPVSPKSLPAHEVMVQEVDSPRVDFWSCEPRPPAEAPPSKVPAPAAPAHPRHPSLPISKLPIEVAARRQRSVPAPLVSCAKPASEAPTESLASMWPDSATAASSVARPVKCKVQEVPNWAMPRPASQGSQGSESSLAVSQASQVEEAMRKLLVEGAAKKQKKSLGAGLGARQHQSTPDLRAAAQMAAEREALQAAHPVSYQQLQPRHEAEDTLGPLPTSQFASVQHSAASSPAFQHKPASASAFMQQFAGGHHAHGKVASGSNSNGSTMTGLGMSMRHGVVAPHAQDAAVVGTVAGSSSRSWFKRKGSEATTMTGGGSSSSLVSASQSGMCDSLLTSSTEFHTRAKVSAEGAVSMPLFLETMRSTSSRPSASNQSTAQQWWQQGSGAEKLGSTMEEPGVEPEPELSSSQKSGTKLPTVGAGCSPLQSRLPGIDSKGPSATSSAASTQDDKAYGFGNPTNQKNRARDLLVNMAGFRKPSGKTDKRRGAQAPVQTPSEFHGGPQVVQRNMRPSLSLPTIQASDRPASSVSSGSDASAPSSFSSAVRSTESILRARKEEFRAESEALRDGNTRLKQMYESKQAAVNLYKENKRLRKELVGITKDIGSIP